MCFPTSPAEGVILPGGCDVNDETLHSIISSLIQSLETFFWENKFVAYVFTFPECMLRTLVACRWSERVSIEAEIEFVAFLRHRRYRLCCVMPILFFFSPMSQTQNKTEMTGSLNDHQYRMTRTGCREFAASALFLIFKFSRIELIPFTAAHALKF